MGKYFFSLPPQWRNKRYPLTMRIPPDRANVPGLALPSDQWRRLNDGGIEVIFNDAEELSISIEATRAIRNHTTITMEAQP